MIRTRTICLAVVLTILTPFAYDALAPREAVAGGYSGGPKLPSQTGNSGKYLTTNGTVPSWGTVSSGVPTSRTVSTTSPLGGGGALSGDLTLTCTTCLTTGTNTGNARVTGTFQADSFLISPGVDTPGGAGFTLFDKPKWVVGNQQTTVGAAGGASALPGAPSIYFKVLASTGTTYVIPAWLP